MTDQAMKALQEVIDRFPTSQYSRDAKLKVDLARDHMAGKEMAIGRYYQKSNELLAALNRFKVVAEQYQTTTHVPEALHRMVEIYVALGLTEDAKRTAAVLGHNFPGSQWYEDTFSLVRTGRATPTSLEQHAWYDWVPGLGPTKEAGSLPPPPPRTQKAAKDSPGWFDWLWPW